MPLTETKVLTSFSSSASSLSAAPSSSSASSSSSCSSSPSSPPSPFPSDPTSSSTSPRHACREFFWNKKGCLNHFQKKDMLHESRQVLGVLAVHQIPHCGIR